jgi:hypothetical protein
MSHLLLPRCTQISYCSCRIIGGVPHTGDSAKKELTATDYGVSSWSREPTPVEDAPFVIGRLGGMTISHWQLANGNQCQQPLGWSKLHARLHRFLADFALKTKDELCTRQVNLGGPNGRNGRDGRHSFATNVRSYPLVFCLRDAPGPSLFAFICFLPPAICYWKVFSGAPDGRRLFPEVA